jgi:hypothetical protein
VVAQPERLVVHAARLDRDHRHTGPLGELLPDKLGHEVGIHVDPVARHRSIVPAPSGVVA